MVCVCDWRTPSRHASFSDTHTACAAFSTFDDVILPTFGSDAWKTLESKRFSLFGLHFAQRKLIVTPSTWRYCDSHTPIVTLTTNLSVEYLAHSTFAIVGFSRVHCGTKDFSFFVVVGHSHILIGTWARIRRLLFVRSTLSKSSPARIG